MHRRRPATLSSRTIALVTAAACAIASAGRAVASPRPQRVTDFGQQFPNSSQPRRVWPVSSGVGMFVAWTPLTGFTLWRTDGTDAGTFRLADVTSGNEPSEITGGAQASNGYVFSINNVFTADQAWRTDGTREGTQRLEFEPFFRQIVVGSAGGLAYVNSSSGNTYRVWVTDGTQAGTRPLKDPGASAASTPGSMGGLAAVPGSPVAYFAGALGSSAGSAGTPTLWRTDGTSAGTYPVGGAFGGPLFERPSRLTTVGTKVIYRANEFALQLTSPLCISDGTSAGTRLVRPPDADPACTTCEWRASPIARVGAYTLVIDADARLWSTTDGDAWTRLGVEAPPPYAPGSAVRWLVAADADGERALVTGYVEGTGGRFCCVTDGTPGGTVYHAADGAQLTILGDAVFYVRSTTDLGYWEREPWISPGPPAAPAILRNIHPTDASIPVQFPSPWATRVGPLVYFPADDGAHGVELWATDGTTPGTRMVKDVDPGTAGLHPGMFADMGGGRAVFAGLSDGPESYAPWKTDLTPAGTAEVQRAPGVPAGRPRAFLRVPGGPVLAMTYPCTQDRCNQDDVGTLIAIGPGGAAVDLTTPGTWTSQLIGALASPAGVAIMGRSSANGAPINQLWATDGTPAGTRPVLPAAAFDLGTRGMTGASMDSFVLFTASRPAEGVELWRTDATEAGTSLVKDLRPGAASSSPFFLTRLSGTLAVFFADDGVGGVEPWVTDGTPAGTFKLADISPTTAATSPTAPVVMGGKAYFTAITPGAGRELWVTDGTPAGTRMVVNLAPGLASAFNVATPSGPSPLIPGAGVLYFVATNSLSGEELWVSDGTAAGTRLVVDLAPGTASPYPAAARPRADSAVVVRGRLFYTHRTAADGDEMWVSDGTPEGTRLFVQIAPGPYSGVPRVPFRLGDTLVFAADDGVAGSELWTLPLCPADADLDGAVGLLDIFRFLTLWFGAHPGADFDDSGAPDLTDIFAFLTAWFGGC